MEWIILLSLQVGATVMFLLATALYTQSVKAEVLRGSALAILVALDKEGRNLVGGVGSVSGLKRTMRPLMGHWVDDRIMLGNSKGSV